MFFVVVGPKFLHGSDDATITTEHNIRILNEQFQMYALQFKSTAI